MSLLPRERDFRDFGRNFFNDDYFFNNMFAGNDITTDIKETDDAYILDADLPGFNKENINLSYDSDVLTISAKQDTGKDETDEEGNYIRRERSNRSFKRQFLIQNIDKDGISASYNDGVLRINLPKETDTTTPSHHIEID